MNPMTGDIKAYIDMTEDEKKEFSVPVPDNMLDRLNKMNRHERRKWAAEQRRRPDNRRED